jgi:hypothetical protein
MINRIILVFLHEPHKMRKLEGHDSPCLQKNPNTTYQTPVAYAFVRLSNHIGQTTRFR